MSLDDDLLDDFANLRIPKQVEKRYCSFEFSSGLYTFRPLVVFRVLGIAISCATDMMAEIVCDGEVISPSAARLPVLPFVAAWEAIFRNEEPLTLARYGGVITPSSRMTMRLFMPGEKECHPVEFPNLVWGAVLR